MSRFGLTLPNFGVFGDPAAVVRLAITAEEAGWDGCFLWDHLRAGDWAGPVIDPWVTLGAVAQATRRIAIGPMVTPLPRRRPAKLARETVTLDHLSAGRLVLGLGIGWPPQEDFGDFGDAADNRVRAAQLDEGLEVLTGLWSGRALTHHGPHYRVEGASFLPVPFQPRIPIWLGAAWPHRRPFRRAARWDGVFPLVDDPEEGFRSPTPSELRSIVDYTMSQRRDGGPFAVAVSPRGEVPTGKLQETVAAYREAGATWWIEPLGWPPRPLPAWLEKVAAGPLAPGLRPPGSSGPVGDSG